MKNKPVFCYYCGMKELPILESLSERKLSYFCNEVSRRIDPDNPPSDCPIVILKEANNG